MKKEKLIQIRINREVFEKFKKYAKRKDVSKSELIRGFIRRVTRKV
jgi:antitoxin component of RelBE/YafQ-DinJ toxin-antitoxin module